MGFVRLACLIHAANVRSEPGSNPSQSVLCSQFLTAMVEQKQFESPTWNSLKFLKVSQDKS